MSQSEVDRAEEYRKRKETLQERGLMGEALYLLEWVTFHDGRYGQEESAKFQNEAQDFVLRAAKVMGRTPYQDFGTKQIA
jgi:TPP-dependent pyruvate/acetoin dehydrogenase alpha subunit